LVKTTIKSNYFKLVKLLYIKSFAFITIVMDFTCVVSPVCVISKRSTLCIIIVDADPVYSLAKSIEPGRQWHHLQKPIRKAYQLGLGVAPHTIEAH